MPARMHAHPHTGHPARPPRVAPRAQLAVPMTESLRAFLARLWETDPLLTGTGLLLLALLVPSTLGIWLDPRDIGGAPAWLKPAKFALSTAVYTLTLAWVFTFMPDWPRMRRIVGRTTAAVMLIEMAIIDLQAWRGTTSHFNVSTPLDATLFGLSNRCSSCCLPASPSRRPCASNPSPIAPWDGPSAWA